MSPEPRISEEQAIELTRVYLREVEGLQMQGIVAVRHTSAAQYSSILGEFRSCGSYIIKAHIDTSPEALDRCTQEACIADPSIIKVNDQTGEAQRFYTL